MPCSFTVWADVSSDATSTREQYVQEASMRRVCAAVALLAALVWASPASAQRTTGEIIGKVVDESGGVLPGVTITLRGAGVAGAPSVVTSETGAYRFPVLPPGTYDLDYELTGFGTFKREGIVIS